MQRTLFVLLVVFVTACAPSPNSDGPPLPRQFEAQGPGQFVYEGRVHDMRHTFRGVDGTKDTAFRRAGLMVIKRRYTSQGHDVPCHVASALFAASARCFQAYGKLYGPASSSLAAPVVAPVRGGVRLVGDAFGKLGTVAARASPLVNPPAKGHPQLPSTMHS